MSMWDEEPTQDVVKIPAKIPTKSGDPPVKKPKFSTEAKMTIIDAWSVVKSHGSGKLKARYRTLVEEIEQ